MAQILIDAHDPFGRPAEPSGAILQRVWACRAFRMRAYVLEGTLPDVHTGQAVEMASRHRLGHHGGTSRSVSSTSCRRRVRVCTSVQRRIARPAASTTNGSGGARVVQAVGRARRRPVAGSWKKTRGSPQARCWATRGNCRPEKGWKGWVTVKISSPSMSWGVVDDLFEWPRGRADHPSEVAQAPGLWTRGLPALTAARQAGRLGVAVDGRP
jgi:hypothetical protein